MSTAPLRRLDSSDTEALPMPAANGPLLPADVLPPRAPAPRPDVRAPMPARPALPAPARLRAWIEAHAINHLLAACSLGGMVLFWHLVTTHRVNFYIRFANIPTPADVLHSVLEVSGNGKFLANIGMSVRRIFLGFALAGLLGIAMGLAIGRYRRLRQVLFPALEVLRPIPAIAWVPISIMLWPDNEVSIVFITFIGAFFPVLLNTVSGVEAVDPVLLRAGQCLGAGERQLMWHVVLPGALPQIFTGLAVGMGVAWVSLIAAEMISGQFGIGYFTWEAYSLISYPDIVLGMITIGVLGLMSSGLIRAAGHFLMPWIAFTKPGGRS